MKTYATHTRAILLAALLIIAGCGAPGERGSAESEAITVQTVTVEEADVSLWAKSYTRLQGANQANIYGTGGTVDSILVTQGDTVAAGQLLMVLSTDTENIASASASSAGVSTAATALAMATDNLERVTALYNAGGASDQEILNAQLSEQSARSALYSAQATSTGTTSRSSSAMVTAPFGGVIGRIPVTVGSLSSATQPLITVASADLLKAEILLSEDAVGKIEEGDPAYIEVSSVQNLSFSGIVTSVAPYVDLTTGLVAVEVSITNEQNTLVPGMAAEISVQLDIHQAVVAIPELSLINGTDGYQVAIEENGEAVIRTATVGYRENGIAEITSGLQAGESLIVAGQQLVSDGSPVHSEVQRNVEELI